MRWLQHWSIGRVVRDSGFSLFYQLGTILPDWFERHPIHRYVDNAELFYKRLENLSDIKNRAKYNYLLGTMVHYICDYCTESHNEKYWHLFHHRVYEVKSQKLFFKNQNRQYNIDSLDMITFRDFLENNLIMLREEIDKIDSDEWYTDERIMTLDTKYAYKICKGLIQFMKGKDKR